MAQRKLAAVYVTITTLDAQLARILEPRAAAPQAARHRDLGACGYTGGCECGTANSVHQ
jgi:DNA repair photolyase